MEKTIVTPKKLSEVISVATGASLNDVNYGIIRARVADEPPFIELNADPVLILIGVDESRDVEFSRADLIHDTYVDDEGFLITSKGKLKFYKYIPQEVAYD